MTTNISWAEDTLNPVVGCSMVSPGCANCYAIPQAYRLEKIGESLGAGAGRLAYYEGLTELRDSGRRGWTGKVVFVPEALDIPVKRRKPTTYFVNSMSDLFHPGVSSDDILRVFLMMRSTPQHRYMILTKRPQRMFEWMSEWYPGAEAIANGTFEIQPPPANVYLGVSVESQVAADKRIPWLLKTPAAGRFISAEPLLGMIELSKVLPVCGDEKSGIDLVIAGGESGPRARQCDIRWLILLVMECREMGVKIHIKQLGQNPTGWVGESVGKNADPKLWPRVLQVQDVL